jgi:hypothetical protein
VLASKWYAFVSDVESTAAEVAADIASGEDEWTCNVLEFAEGVQIEVDFLFPLSRRGFLPAELIVQNALGRMQVLDADTQNEVAEEVKQVLSIDRLDCSVSVLSWAIAKHICCFDA